MNRMRTRTKVLALTAAGLAGAGVLTGVASAATGTHAAGTGGPTAGGAAAGVAGHRHLARQLATHAVHGEVVVNTKQGMQTVDFQRGTVETAGTGEFTVTDASGTTETWAIGPDTKIRDRAAQPSSTSADLVSGEQVVVIGTKTGDALTARLVVVRPAPASPAPATTAPGTSAPA